MPQLNLCLEGEGCWPDLAALDAGGKMIALMGPAAPPIGVAYLRGGMKSGKGSVTFRIELPDGRVVITETSLALFLQAADYMRAAELRGTGAGGNPGRDG